jgi:hypothetical protein
MKNNRTSNSPSNNPPKGDYRYAGQTRDGVWIIKPSHKPTHFSNSEISEAFGKVGRESVSGRFADRKK